VKPVEPSITRPEFPSVAVTETFVAVPPATPPIAEPSATDDAVELTARVAEVRSEAALRRRKLTVVPATLFVPSLI